MNIVYEIFAIKYKIHSGDINMINLNIFNWFIWNI